MVWTCPLCDGPICPWQPVAMLLKGADAVPVTHLYHPLEWAALPHPAVVVAILK